MTHGVHGTNVSLNRFHRMSVSLNILSLFIDLSVLLID